MKTLINILGYTGIGLFVIGVATGENFMFFTGVATITATLFLNRQEEK
jgi:hypothetical protein